MPSLRMASDCALFTLSMQAGRHTEAVHSYRAAQDAVAAASREPNPAAMPALSSQLYLQLAKSYATLKHPDWALQVYTAACSRYPSASAWLGVGACRMALEDYDAAGQALSEAALLDPENPSVWGRMAIVSSKAGRSEEAAGALKVSKRAVYHEGGCMPCLYSLMLKLASDLSFLSRPCSVLSAWASKTLPSWPTLAVSTPARVRRGRQRTSTVRRLYEDNMQRDKPGGCCAESAA